MGTTFESILFYGTEAENLDLDVKMSEFFEDYVPGKDYPEEWVNDIENDDFYMSMLRLDHYDSKTHLIGIEIEVATEDAFYKDLDNFNKITKKAKSFFQSVFGKKVPQGFKLVIKGS